MPLEELIHLAKAQEATYWNRYMAGISVDCVVFGFQRDTLNILLVRLKGSKLWALPGGYILKEEGLDEGAHRILFERTGAERIFLEQFKTFGQLQRSEEFFKDFPDNSWHRQRFISIGYYALINEKQVSLKTDLFSDRCEWVGIEAIPSLMMDHHKIYQAALRQLRLDLNNKPIGSNLLPEKFTMPELQKLYETILGKKLNRGNFYRKIKRYDILEKLDETRRGGAHKSPDLYRFNMENYRKILEQGALDSW